MKPKELMLLQRELDLLKKHLNASNLSDRNKKQLLSELESAKVMKENDLPADVVSINSVVEIQEVGSGQKFHFQIVMPPETNMHQKRISVFAPIAIALLGYRTGSTVQWEMPNGLKAFKILNVQHKEKFGCKHEV